MKYLFLLSKENIAMAKDEVFSLVGSKNYDLVGNLLIIDINSLTIDSLSKRLGYTKKIFRLLFSCKSKNAVENLKKYNWNKIYKKDFCLRIEGDSKYTEKELAEYVWNGLKNPKVKLDNPRTAVFVFFIGGKCYCCLLENELKQDFDNRKAHKRPELHPSSMHPRLARVLVNLTGILKGEIVDPFCGSGGILIEAGLMGLRGVGYDIDQIMLTRAKINLEYYSVKNFKLVKKDALKLKRKINYIVTDLPYGKNTKKTELGLLYSGFLINLRKVLSKRAVVVFPVFPVRNINYSKLIQDGGLKIVSKYEIYIHKSMSKRIFVIEKS